MTDYIVSTDWLAENLDNDKLILLDASMKKVVGKEPIEYQQPLHLPNSKRFDLENVFCNVASSQNNAFPTQEQFTQSCIKLGVDTDSFVVVYDNQGIYSSPRAWWIFRAMGITNVFVLDGGLPQWQLEQRALVTELSETSTENGNILGDYQTHMVCNSTDISHYMATENCTLLDARSTARFLGVKPEPRQGVRSGHIPQSINLPFAQILDNHCFKSQQQLTDIFATLIPNKEDNIIFSCGSGITACIIMLAAAIAGYQNTILYDGSWSDWGSDNSLPIEQG